MGGRALCARPVHSTVSCSGTCRETYRLVRETAPVEASHVPESVKSSTGESGTSPASSKKPPPNAVGAPPPLPPPPALPALGGMRERDHVIGLTGTEEASSSAGSAEPVNRPETCVGRGADELAMVCACVRVRVRAGLRSRFCGRDLQQSCACIRRPITRSPRGARRRGTPPPPGSPSRTPRRSTCEWK